MKCNRFPEHLELPVCVIKVHGWAEYEWVGDPTSAIIAAFGGAFRDARTYPDIKSTISGAVNTVCYMSGDIGIYLTIDELERLLRLNLTPTEFHRLIEVYGTPPPFEWHEDFYDQETGEALQPR